MDPSVRIPKSLLFIINQIFELEQKINKLQEQNSLKRNIDKIKEHFEMGILPDGNGIVYHSPINEGYNITRTDCEATITGEGHENLVIIEVLKPIIYVKFNNTKLVIQKAVVIVKSKNK